MQLKSLSPERQQRVIKLHSEAFARGKEVCGPCKGSCCKDCASASGYLRDWRIPDKEQDAKIKALKKKHGFDNKRGFLSDTGCKLPLEERSEICLGFICWDGGFRTVRPNQQSIWKDEERAAAHSIKSVFYEHDKEARNV